MIAQRRLASATASTLSREAAPVRDRSPGCDPQLVMSRVVKRA